MIEFHHMFKTPSTHNLYLSLYSSNFAFSSSASSVALTLKTIKYLNVKFKLFLYSSIANQSYNLKIGYTVMAYIVICSGK